MIVGDLQREYVESADGTRIAVLVQRRAGPPAADRLAGSAASADQFAARAAPADQIVGRATATVPALLVHGFGSNARANWQATGWFRTLAQAGIPTAALDLRGHGESDRPHRPSAYTVAAFIADLAAVLGAMPEWFGPSPEVDLIGYSLGGRMAVELAGGSGGLAGGSGGPAPSAEILSPAPRRLVVGGHDGRRLLGTIDVAELTRLIRSGEVSPPGESPAAHLVRIARAVPGNDPEALLAVVAGLIRDGRVTEPAPAPTLQTLVVAGSADVVADRAREWAASLPAGRAVIVPDRNHITTVTAAVFRKAAAEFLTV